MMRRSKLILVSILLILVMLFSLISCASDRDLDEEDTDEPNKSEQSSSNKTDDSTEDKGNKDDDKDKEDDKKSETSEYATRTYKFVEIEDKVKLLGRSQMSDTGINCDFTASGVEFKAYIKSSLRFTVWCNNDTYFTVFVDGERQGGADGRYMAKGGSDTTITVSNLGDMALREIRIIKETEPQYSISVLKKMIFYGALEGAADEKDMYIEFLGDSITCGYGNLIANGVNNDNAWRPVNSDGTRAYAFLTAEKLNADSSIISCSGIGVDQGWTSFNEITYYSKASYFRDNKLEQDFKELRVPDVVVINLGTNDNAYSPANNKQQSTEAQFKQNAKGLIEFIRSSYGKDMPIVWAYNMMGACCADWTKAVINELGGDSARLYTVELNENRAGGNGHPNLAAHETAATTLASFIKTIPLDDSGERIYYNRTYSLESCAPLVKQVGRTAVTTNGLICDFTASGIEFNAYVKGNLKFTVNCSRDTYFTVMVDGVRLAQNTTDATERFYAAGGSDVTIDVGNLGNTMALHEIRILKQTEPQNSLCVIKSVQFNGVLDSAAEEKDLYIEFLGDSITCGYGNIGGVGMGNAAGGALYQDGTKTYAFLAAEALGADASVISCSGIGIDNGWTAFNEMAFYSRASSFRDWNKMYDFSDKRVPDIVVINLGTNDNANSPANNKYKSEEDEFKQNAKDLINFIRTSYGKDVPIVWAYNMMGACCFEWTSAVLTELGGEANGLYSVQLTANNAGGNGHPTLQAQIDNSVILADFIKSKGLNKK